MRNETLRQKQLAKKRAKSKLYEVERNRATAGTQADRKLRRYKRRSKLINSTQHA